MRYIYTYQTKNLINGKTYIGVHSTNKLNDGYIGNGVTSRSYPKSQIKANKANPFVLAVYKYGYDNFKKEILCFFDTQEEAYKEESFLVDYKWVKSKDNYNVALGGMYNLKPYKLYSYKILINEMYSDANISYRNISEKFNVTKGGWIGLITNESRIKRNKSTKISFYNGLEVVNLYGQVEVLIDEGLFFKKTGLTKKTIHKLNKSGYSCGWYIKGSDKYINKINEIEDRGIDVNGKYYELKEVYSEGVKVFSEKHNIYISTLEKKINNAKNTARGGK